MPNPAAAVPIVDTSASMSGSGYATITVIDTKAFLSFALEGDYIGVASYDTSGRVTYALAQVTAGLGEPKAAAAAVQALSFNGSCTDMGGGLQTGVTMVGAAPSSMPHALVLLSDGYQNCGTSPIPLPSGCPPVYSCAMGPRSDQGLMQNIATQSNGKYYYAPYVYDMMKIYNEIRAQTPDAALIANDYKNATPNDFLLIPGTVAQGNDLGQFSVVWSDPSIPFVNGHPGVNQIGVTLVDPSGTTLTPMPTLQGPGYVVFNIPNPAVGQWYIQIEYGGQKPQGLTGGAFEYSPGGNAAPIAMTAVAPASVRAGSPIEFSVALEDDGAPITGQAIRTTVTRPRFSVRKAAAMYAPLLKDIVLPEGEPDDDLARLRHLHRTQLPEQDLLPHVRRGGILTQTDDRPYTATIEDTAEAGSYTVTLDVTGFSKRSGTPFSRSHQFSVLVEE